MCCIRAQERAGKRQHRFSSSSLAWWDRMWGEDSDTRTKNSTAAFRFWSQGFSFRLSQSSNGIIKEDVYSEFFCVLTQNKSET